MTRLTTKAAVLVELNRPLRLIELSLPALKPGQVLVEVAYSGICHSQLNEVRGRKGPDRYLPHTLGHEGSGRVVAVGEGVSKVKAGDRVVLSWIKGRGADVTGTVYDSPEGAINSGAISTLVRQTVTCENRVIAIPGAMPLREAALLGCAVPTGAGIVFNTLRIEAGSSLAVFGVGGIGLSAVLAAVGLGARPIIAVDVVAEKLDMASELGATHVVNAGDIDPVAAVRELTRGEGVDFAIEAAGRAEAMEAAFESVRAGGGLCVLAGNLAHGEKFAVDPFSLIAGKRIIGTWGGESRPDRDIPRYVEMFRDGRLALERLIAREYPLGGINEAFDDLEKGRVVRPIIRMTGGDD